MVLFLLTLGTCFGLTGKCTSRRIHLICRVLKVGCSAAVSPWAPHTLTKSLPLPAPSAYVKHMGVAFCHAF